MRRQTAADPFTFDPAMSQFHRAQPHYLLLLLLVWVAISFLTRNTSCFAPTTDIGAGAALGVHGVGLSYGLTFLACAALPLAFHLLIHLERMWRSLWHPHSASSPGRVSRAERAVTAPARS